LASSRRKENPSIAFLFPGASTRSVARGQGSRSGPAGNRKPLPVPRSSKTQISRSRCENFDAIVAVTPVTARNHAHPAPARLQVLHQRHDDRGFTRPTSDHIAHDDDGHSQLMNLQYTFAVQPFACRRECPIQQRQRPQQKRNHAASVPCADQQLSHVSVSGSGRFRRRLTRRWQVPPGFCRIPGRH
jgi:hypothetical protein